MFSIKDCYLLSIGCIAILLIGCLSSKEGASAKDASDRSDVVAPPAIITYILEEEQGIDSLSLKQVVVGQGYLKTELDFRVGKALPNQFRISLLSSQGDTLAQVLAASALNERLESSLEDGTIRSVEVNHPTAVHVIRTARPKAASIFIEKANTVGEIIATQSLTIQTDL